MKRIRTLVVTGAAAAAVLSGCRPPSSIRAATPPAKDFIVAEQPKQAEAVSKMLTDEHGTDPANLEITATRIAALTYCQMLGKEDTKIRESPHG